MQQKWVPNSQHVQEVRSVRDYAKKANLGVKQRGVRACTPREVAEFREKNVEGGFLWLGKFQTRSGTAAVM